MKSEGATEAAKGDSSETVVKSIRASSASNVPNLITLMEPSPILLKTVMNQVSSGSSEADANILFHDCSQETFFTISFQRCWKWSRIYCWHPNFWRLLLSFVGDCLIGRCGPVAIESQLGYLLAGRTGYTETHGMPISSFHIASEGIRHGKVLDDRITWNPSKCRASI